MERFLECSKGNHIAPDMSFYLLDEMHDSLVAFRECQNISLEMMKENDGKFTEFAYWIGEAIIRQEEYLELQELEFDDMSRNLENLLTSGKYPDTPKMTATDAKRNAPVLLKEQKIRLIKIKTYLKRLKNIDNTLFKAINANARSIRINEKIY